MWKPVKLAVAAMLLSSALSAQTEIDHVYAIDGGQGDEFGRSVTIDGDFMVVASLDEFYVFYRDDKGDGDPLNDTWEVPAVAKYPMPNPGGSTTSSAGEGTTVALSGNTLLVGNGWGGAAASKTGVASIYGRVDPATPGDLSDDTWLEVDQLVAPVGAGDAYGSAVAIDGDYAIVGGPFNDNTAPNAGRAWVFERDDMGNGDPFDDEWNLAQDFGPLTASAGNFGISVAISGSRGLIGSPGHARAFVIERSPVGWVLEAELTGSSQFGQAVALDGDTAAVGQATGVTGNPGSVSIFRFTSATGWFFEDAVGQEIGLPTVTVSTDTWADSVALSGNTLVVGDPGHNWGFYSDGGCAHVFGRSDNGSPGDLTNDFWTESGSFFQGSETDFGDQTGFSLAMDGDIVVAGAIADEGTLASRAGSAYVFQANPPVIGFTLGSAQSEISLGDGGSQILSLDTPDEFGEDFYWMFGSATGTEPGIDFGDGVTLPLVFDGYFNSTLSSPFQPAFTDFVAQLAPNGAATAILSIPAGSNVALAGLQLFHAYLVIDEVTLDVEFASNAVGLTLVP